ncbi:hypothetical protein ARMSODRAFT_749706 [Armillaria solidipes]|uniref:Cysteine-rich transmembrane CYSTM domain-containing protein n=1 Tax=Armillaria solidipes TaxID=1076256 RepID=A0A2H3C1T7_9AGAR|nr:hypothetical protein ARMSODRAFT_749706 [Armillaria solidipes]
MAANDYYGGGGKPQNQYYPPQGPPQGQGGYYPGPQAPQQSYQGYPQQGYPQQGGYGGGYQPQPQPQTVVVPRKAEAGAQVDAWPAWLECVCVAALKNCANACFNRALCSPGCGHRHYVFLSTCDVSVFFHLVLPFCVYISLSRACISGY